MKKTFKYCDICEIDITEIKKGNGYLKLQAGVTDTPTEITIHHDELCEICANKIKDFIETLKNTSNE